MQVTEVNINFIKPKDSLIGFASVVLDNKLYLSSIGIHHKLNSPGNFRITYPSKQSGSKEFQVFHPIRSETGNAIETAILKKLKDVMSKANDGYGKAGT